MLNDEDKKELAKLVAKELKTNRPEYLGMSKSEIAKAEKKKELSDRQVKLQFLKDYNRDTLAQRIELEKIKFQNTKAGRVTNVTGKVTGEVAKLAGGLSSAVLGSKASKGLADALLYSNPITALIAQNMDLFKGVGKVGLQGLKLGGKAAFGTASFLYKTLRRPKGFPKSSSAAENVLTSKKQDNNYVLTKSAVFIGGKNYLMLGSGLGNGLGGGAFTALTGKQDLLEDKIGAPKPLTDKKSTASIMKKGLDGIQENVKKGNKLSEKLNKTTKLLLIATLLRGAAILAGIAGIFAGVSWLKDHLNKGSEEANFQLSTIPTTVNTAALNPDSLNKLANMQESTTALKETKFFNKNFSGFTFGGAADKFANATGNKKGSAVYDALKYAAGDRGMPASYRSFQATSKVYFRLPIKVKIVKYIPGKVEGELGCIVLCKIGTLRGGNLVVTGVIELRSAPKGEYEANDIIAILDPNYQIFGDLSGYSEGKDYLEYVNKMNTEEEIRKGEEHYNKLRQDSKYNEGIAAWEKSISDQYAFKSAAFETYKHPVESVKQGFDIITNNKDEVNRNVTTALSNAQSKQTSPSNIRKKSQKGTSTGFATPITTNMNITSSTKLQYSANDPASEQAKITNIIRTE